MCKSIYIHIPFCKTICSYCDFCKFFYNKKYIHDYFKQLKLEIESKYKKEEIETIYIGGGTPSCLDLEELKTLFDIIKIFKKSTKLEFTIECNVETLNEEKIKLFSQNGVNRVSIGVQSLLPKNIDFLERHHNIEMVKDTILLFKKYNINNINLDLMYALPNQTILDLKYDLDNYISFGITHISTYSLMIEPNTKIYIKNIQEIDEDLDRRMYEFICNYLKEHNFIHYEISNFSLEGYESKHNLTYWDNDEYYGFGIGASGYILNVRYDNTKSITKYLGGEYVYTSDLLTNNIILENEFILGLRKIKGINKKDFKSKYNIELCDIIIVKNLLKLGLLVDDLENIFIPADKLYVSNSILLNFVGGSYE